MSNDITAIIDERPVVASIEGVIINWNGGQPVQTITSTDGSISAIRTAENVDLATNFTKKVLVDVRNNTGATLTKGTAVYINGAIGQISTVAKAQANSDATSAQTLGLITEDLPKNTNGKVIVIGLLDNLNTSAYTDGQQLYLSPTTAGTLTTTKPSAPQHLVYVAIVEHSHPTQGKLMVKVQNGYELDELHDVDAKNPSNNDFIKYNSTSGIWDKTQLKTIENQSILGSGNIDLTKSDVGLGNVDNTSDVNKPISTATQTALDGKVNKTGDTINGVFQNSTTAKTQIILEGTNAGDNADGTPNTNSSPRIELKTFQVSEFTSGESQKGGFSEVIRLVSGDTQAKPTIAYYDHNYKPIAWLVAHFQPQDLRIYANLASFPVTGVNDGLRAYFAQDTGKYYTWNGSTYVELTTSNSEYYYRAIHQHISLETSDITGVANYTRFAIPYNLDVVPITTSNAHLRVTEGTKNGKAFGAFIVDSGKMFSYSDIILYPDSNNASSVETWKDSATDNIFTNNTKGIRFRLLDSGNADNIVSGQEILAMDVQGLNWLGINENVVIGGATSYSLGINRSAGVTLDVRRDLGVVNDTNYIIQRLSRTDGAFFEFGYIGNGTDLDNFLIRAGSSKGLVIGTTSSPRGFIFTNSGNLGIGNKTPAARLHTELNTNGNIIIARNTTVDGNTTANIISQTQTTSSRIFQGGLQSDTVNRLSIEASGLIEWGAGGSTARDTNLYRSNANELKTDDAFVAVGKIKGNGFDANSQIITNVATPISNTDAVNKTYVDTMGSTTTAGNTVTINARKGYFTTATLTTGAGGGTPTITLNNTEIVANDFVRWSFDNYSATVGTNGVPHIVGLTTTTGQATATIINLHSTNALNGTIRIFFEVMKI